MRNLIFVFIIFATLSAWADQDEDLTGYKPYDITKSKVRDDETPLGKKNLPADLSEYRSRTKKDKNADQNTKAEDTNTYPPPNRLDSH